MATLHIMRQISHRLGTAGRHLGCLKTLTKNKPNAVAMGSVTLSKYKTFSSEASRSSHEDVPISRYPIPDRQSLPQDIQERMNVVEEKGGFLPNVFKALAHRPDEFRAFFAFYDALMEKESETLTKAEKEMIVVATSSYNDCLYCVVAHSALHRIFSKNKYKADQIAVCPESANLSSREHAIVEFAMSLCKSEPVTDDMVQGLLKEGLSLEDVWDVGAITALFALSNRMAHLTNMRPNEEFYLMGRVKHEKKK